MVTKKKVIPSLPEQYDFGAYAQIIYCIFWNSYPIFLVQSSQESQN